MRKILSLMLAILMVVSVTVVAANAADADAAATGVETATVTLTSVKGNSVTQTYAVGETFTAYTYLNASNCNEGKIGSLNGSQEYTSSILEVAETYVTDVDDYDYGLLEDVDTIFPILKSATVGNAGIEGIVYYNASIPSKAGFKFNADDRALVILRYTVKAAGEATITNRMQTLAVSDDMLTRIIDKGAIVNPDFTSPVALSEPAPLPVTSTVSGTITSYSTSADASDEILVELIQDNKLAYSATVNGNTVAYSIADVADGDYILRVHKENHVSRDYEITVSGDTTQDVKICPIGDTNLNGRVQSNDGMFAYKHAQGGAADKLEGYAFKCADVNNNGRVQSNDAMAIYKQASGEHNLF
ncbi:MAG: hypothetical protein IJV48_02680 [Ruminococcus sp.]|nr:hypothetical protein [Ruminococcus sp.]